MKKYDRYIIFFKKQIPNIIDQYRGLILREIPYDFNKNSIFNKISMYDNCTNYITPSIKKRNNMYKFNGSLNWLNLLNHSWQNQSNLPNLQFVNYIWLLN